MGRVEGFFIPYLHNYVDKFLLVSITPRATLYNYRYVACYVTYLIYFDDNNNICMSYPMHP